ncbi:MAG: 3-phosphoshikimate 1-carboxyvinyltransferase [Planctomycetes bacterium]|nr:3-phosphoshikimate 1-carboxyvinyltransferase [Planctomycetota bacterium]
MQYPHQIAIAPLTKPPHATVRVPGSKSITNRALVLAALTAHETVIDGALQSEDTEVMVDCLRRLGFTILPDWEAESIRVLHDSAQPRIPASSADLYVANSGTTMRFLAAMVALGNGRYRLDGVPRMRERPIADLLNALDQLGVKAVCEFNNGCPPVVIEANGLPGGTVHIRGDTSSQFLSGLLMAGSMARGDVIIIVDGPLVSVPYVSMTVAMMRQFGLSVFTGRAGQFAVHAPQTPKVRWHYLVEPDASAASYFFGAAAITGGRVTIPRLTKHCLQGDVRFLDVLNRMGCEEIASTCRPDFTSRREESITVHGGPLRGIDVDLNDISDTVMTLAAVACFAEGPTTIRNVAHIRHKETDRLAALATELRRIGAKVDEFADGLTITPAPLHGAVIQTYNDHRMAMSLALVGLKVPGIVIDNPACVAKTYPRFFDDLERLR